MITLKEYILEMVRSRFAVVDNNNQSHYITDDEGSAKKIAKQKAMSVRQIFAAKDRKPNTIPVRLVKEDQHLVTLEETFRQEHNTSRSDD